MILAKNIPPVRWAVLIGHLLFLGLFILSIVHWKERVIHVDSAYQIFKWVQESGLEVEAHRYSAIVPQIMVKLARALDIGLSGLLVIASVAHVLVPWGIYALAAHAWRSPWVAAASALAAVLCTRLAFYGIVLEANYLLSYPFLLAAALQGPMLRRRDRSGLIIAVLTLFVVLLVHPMGIVLALYVLAFFFAVEPRVRGPVVVLLLLTIVWAVLGRLILPPTGYESELYANAWNGLLGNAPLSDMASVDFLLGHSWQDTTHYLATWILFLAALALLAVQRAWTALALLFFSVPAFLALNVVTFQEGESAVMMEKNFLPLATLIALPLFWAASRLRVQGQLMILGVFLAVAFIQFRGISFASRPAIQRYHVLEELVGEARGAEKRKVAVPIAVLDQNGPGVTWALPFESLLLSSFEGPEASITLIAADDIPIVDDKGGVALPPMADELPVNVLKRHYFSLPEGPYEEWGIKSMR